MSGLVTHVPVSLDEATRITLFISIVHGINEFALVTTRVATCIQVNSQGIVVSLAYAGIGRGMPDATNEPVAAALARYIGQRGHNSALSYGSKTGLISDGLVCSLYMTMVIHQFFLSCVIWCEIFTLSPSSAYSWRVFRCSMT